MAGHHSRGATRAALLLLFILTAPAAAGLAADWRFVEDPFVDDARGGTVRFTVSNEAHVVLPTTVRTFAGTGGTSNQAFQVVPDARPPAPAVAWLGFPLTPVPTTDPDARYAVVTVDAGAVITAADGDNATVARDERLVLVDLHTRSLTEVPGVVGNVREAVVIGDTVVLAVTQNVVTANVVGIDPGTGQVAWQEETFARYTYPAFTLVNSREALFVSRAAAGLTRVGPDGFVGAVPLAGVAQAVAVDPSTGRVAVVEHDPASGGRVTVLAPDYSPRSTVSVPEGTHAAAFTNSGQHLVTASANWLMTFQLGAGRPTIVHQSVIATTGDRVLLDGALSVPRVLLFGGDHVDLRDVVADETVATVHFGGLHDAAHVALDASDERVARVANGALEVYATGGSGSFPPLTLDVPCSSADPARVTTAAGVDVARVPEVRVGVEATEARRIDPRDEPGAVRAPPFKDDAGRSLDGPLKLAPIIWSGGNGAAVITKPADNTTARYLVGAAADGRNLQWVVCDVTWTPPEPWFMPAPSAAGAVIALLVAAVAAVAHRNAYARRGRLPPSS